MTNDVVKRLERFFLGLFGKDHKGRRSQDYMNRKCMLGDLELLTMLLLQSPPDKDKRGQLPEVWDIWHVRNPSLFASIPPEQRLTMFRNEPCIWDRLKKANLHLTPLMWY